MIDKNSSKAAKFNFIDHNYCEKIGLDEESISKTITNYDIINGHLVDLSKNGYQNNLEHYKCSAFHNITDYLYAIQILEEMFPEYKNVAKSYQSSHKTYFNNIFVMKRELFRSYSEWLFDILFALEKHINLKKYNKAESRVFGYIAERLYNIFLAFQKSTKHLKTLDTQLTHIKNTSFLESVHPISDLSKTVAINLAINNSYTPAAGALIQSIIDHASKNYYYDIVVFPSDDISDYNKVLFQRLIKCSPNFSIRFVNIDGYFTEYNLKTHMHISKETYFRLCIPNVFRKYNKVLYLDADMTVLRDVAELFFTNIGNVPLAATEAFRMKVRINNGHTVREIEGKPKARDYLKSYLGMKNISDYFNAGVLLFNIPLALKENILLETKKLCGNGKLFWLMDQDILNYLFENKVMLLDPKWNVLHVSNKERFKRWLPLQDYNAFIRAYQDPFIVHYAGPYKPWLGDNIDFSDFFWASLKKTPWYESVILNCATNIEKKISNTSLNTTTSENKKSQTKRYLLADKIANRVNTLLPTTSKRRSLARALYHWCKPIARKII